MTQAARGEQPLAFDSASDRPGLAPGYCCVCEEIQSLIVVIWS